MGGRTGNPRPARVVPPGKIVRKELEARGWTQEDLARIMGRPVQTISELVSAKKAITPETALGLAAAFGTSAEMWLNMEAAYRLRLAQERAGDDTVARRSRIYSLVPVKELAKRGWLPGSVDTKNVDALERSVVEFFGVASLDEIPDVQLAARRTPTRTPDPRAVRAWMRRVEQLASAQDVGRFDRARLEGTIAELLSRARAPEGVREVPALLKAAGVRFVIVPHLQKTYLDGAVFAGNGNPIVALTLRYDRLDSFWFTLIHELAHLVRGHTGNRPEDLDAGAGNDHEEQQADRLAAEWLVPTEALAAFVEEVEPYFSRAAIARFAATIGRHPAIVIGRLQHDDHIPQANLRTSIPKVRALLEPWIDVAEPAYEPIAESVASSIREPASPYDPEGAVLHWLQSNPGWNSPAEIKHALGLDRSTWNRTIRALLSAGKVERRGEKRGTKYRLKEVPS